MIYGVAFLEILITSALVTFWGLLIYDRLKEGANGKEKK